VRRALGRFEQLKLAYAQEVASGNALRKDSVKVEAFIAGQKRLLGWYKGAYAQEQTLRQDSNAKLGIAQGKATRRGWLVALEGLGLLLLGYVAIK
jgi:hypothetical protein